MYKRQCRTTARRPPRRRTTSGRCAWADRRPAPRRRPRGRCGWSRVDPHRASASTRRSRVAVNIPSGHARVRTFPGARATGPLPITDVVEGARSQHAAPRAGCLTRAVTHPRRAQPDRKHSGQGNRKPPALVLRDPWIRAMLSRPRASRDPPSRCFRSRRSPNPTLPGIQPAVSASSRNRCDMTSPLSPVFGGLPCC